MKMIVTIAPEDVSTLHRHTLAAADMMVGPPELTDSGEDDGSPRLHYDPSALGLRVYGACGLRALAEIIVKRQPTAAGGMTWEPAPQRHTNRFLAGPTGGDLCAEETAFCALGLIMRDYARTLADGDEVHAVIGRVWSA